MNMKRTAKYNIGERVVFDTDNGKRRTGEIIEIEESPLEFRATGEFWYSIEGPSFSGDVPEKNIISLESSKKLKAEMLNHWRVN